MIDIANEETERLLEQMEIKVSRVYARATEESQKKLNDYLKKFKKEDAAFQEAVKKRLKTDEEYKQWREKKIVRQRYFTQMVDTLAEDYTNADKIAMSIVREHLPEVYAINRNFAAYEIEKGSLIDTSFTLYNRRTVEELIKGKTVFMWEPKVDEAKDKRWNLMHLRNEITQGVLQGESIPKISKRLQNVSGMDKAAAIRNARTAVTGAQNGARIDEYKAAQEKGIGIKQRWISTLDMRTRDTHVVMDNEMVEVGEKFSNGLRFPGDPKGAPSEVYNCRCRMVAHLTGFDFAGAVRNNKLGDMSYEEWQDYAKQRLIEKQQRLEQKQNGRSG